MASNVELSGDEIAKVAQNRRSPRPVYFSASSLQQTQISEDFESFLILQDPISISLTLTQLAATAALATIRLDRDAVAFEALVAESDDRSSRRTEVDLFVTAFNTWRDTFRAGKFSDVSEVGLLITDCKATADEIFALDERLTHLERVHQRVKDRIRQSVSTAQLQQLMSWPTPLLAY